MRRYKVVRFYEKGGKRTITTGLTLEQAQGHCNDPETSWKTATTPAARRRTRVMGAWFDGYQEER